jgi:CRP-like cAMP-binding protein
MAEAPPPAALAAIRSELGRVLGDLPAEAIDALAAEAREGFLAGGEELFREGEAGDAAYLILRGRLRAVRADESGGERLLQEMGPGEFVGEMPLVRPGPRAATVRAVRDTHLAALTPEAFARVTERHPEVLRRVAALLVDRLRAQAEGVGLRRAPVRTIVVAPRRIRRPGGGGGPRPRARARPPRRGAKDRLARVRGDISGPRGTAAGGRARSADGGVARGAGGRGRHRGVRGRSGR